jgi:hypothetical protein
MGENLTMDSIELAKSRLKAVMTIKEMAKDLEQHETCLKRECSPLVREVLNTKRIALWEALLRASNFTDMDIVEGYSTNVLLCTKGRLRIQKCVSLMTAGVVV